jgi:hypothetical protein
MAASIGLATAQASFTRSLAMAANGLHQIYWAFNLTTLNIPQPFQLFPMYFPPPYHDHQTLKSLLELQLS